MPTKAEVESRENAEGTGWRQSRATPPGEQLKAIRRRLGISLRQVEGFSQKIARLEQNDEFCISNAWLAQVENKSSIPSIYKLYSLSIIYRLRFTDLLRLFGVDLDRMGKCQLETPLPNTHLASVEVYDRERPVAFPVRFQAEFDPATTNLLSRIVEVWGEIPIAMIQQLDFRKTAYGYIGLEDYTLYPLLRPGSFVQIDNRQRKIQRYDWRTEFDRPIYFVELRDGYACSWCELEGSQLILVPHPLSRRGIRQYEYPGEAEIVGRVTAVAMRIVSFAEDASKHTASAPATAML